MQTTFQVILQIFLLEFGFPTMLFMLGSQVYVLVATDITFTPLGAVLLPPPGGQKWYLN